MNSRPARVQSKFDASLAFIPKFFLLCRRREGPKGRSLGDMVLWRKSSQEQVVIKPRT
jgi:hypothetical protein